jgi:fumarylacetoacetase
MLEIAWKGTKPVAMNDGSQRAFIQDGDSVIMRGYAERDNVRIGFGECKAEVLPAADF